ncbi:MAG: methyl-accepting chemotaxis protein [Lachnospiraceae bacterium]|nr:methyl-accepting chemotaxis protein [Lachnospiraceae bacterium]MDY4617822.1 methyl-accepting chemotaxis protein [Lachnospiraceae bacterium]
MSENKNIQNKKRGTIATKIIIVVALSVIVTNTISLVLIGSNARKQLTQTTQNAMINMVNSSASLINNEMKEKNVDEFTYEEYTELVGDVKMEGIESSYIYVVSEDGTMLYHPTQEKVGQSVENEVVKGLVEQLAAGQKPETSVTDYNFKGVIKYAAYKIIDNNNIVVVSADESDALAGIDRVTTISIVLEIVIAIVAVVIAFIFGKKLAKPLVDLSKIIEEIAEGNINIDFSGIKESNDEIGLISEKMKNMTSALSDIVNKIRSASAVLSKSSMELNTTSEQTLVANGEISKAVEDVAEGSTSMATSIADINDNIGNMGSETNVIDSAVMNIMQQTQTVQQSSKSMSEKMHNMHDSTIKMDEGIAVISERIKKVSDVVDKVGDIIAVIEDISGQTNLLSLNASIEAARAGEAGKGFAVVADEIRALSDNINEELNNIKDIIAKLIEECNECVNASNIIVKDNANQQHEIETVLKEFDSLDVQIVMTAEKTDEIQKLVTDMVALNGSITNSSDGLTDVSATNAAATEQMTANIEELNAMMHGVAEMAGLMRSESEELDEALRYFK